MSSLMHHGVKGQRWGVRRYQNKDGTRTAAGKKHEKTNRLLASTSEDYTSIVKSLSDHDLKMLNYDDEEIKYMREHETLGHDNAEYGLVAHRVIQKDKNGTPVAYVDATGFTAQSLLTGKMAAKVISIDLATKAGDEYRGKGYAIAAGKKMVKWFDTYGYKDYEYMEWAAKEENVASQKVAEKLGFKNYHTSDPGWTLYTYEHKAKHTSIGGTMYIEGNTLILGDSSYLEHHGIRGQRWGVRRFQNRDGSLTNAGRKRLGYATKGAAQTVGKAFKAGVKAGGNAVKAVKAHHEKKEAEKLQKKKEKASKTRLGVMANKDLFTNEEIRKLNERFKLEDEMKMATLQKGVEIAKAVGTIAQNVGTVAKTYEDVTGQSLSPIKRKAAEEKARQDKEDRERRIAREDADEARKAAKEERDIAIHEQTLRKAIAAADTQEFTAQKTKAEADSSVLDAIKKGQDFNGGSGTDASGQSWMEKATSGGKNPFFEEKLKNDPELAAAKAAHDAKAEWKQHEQERDARIAAREKEAAAKQSQPQQKQGGGDDDALFSQKGSLPIDKDRYRNNRAMEKAKQIKEDAAEERAKKQDEKAAKATIDDMMEARRQFTDSARANSNGAFDRETAANYIKGKAKELPSKLNPVNAIARKITNKALKEEEDNARKALENEYKKASRSQGRDEANYTMYYNRVNALQSQGYSERQAKKVADTENPFSSKRNRRFEYNEKVGEIETTHRKNAKEINKANKELTDYYYKLINGPGYDPGTPKREALDRKYAQKRGELERLEKDNNDMLDREKKKAKKILEHSFPIQNGVLFINAGEPYLEHHGVKGMKWGKHLMAGKGEAGAGGGGGEDDEKLKEMAKKAGMSVAEYKQKFASKIGGAASKIGEKISVKDKHLVINGSRSGSRGLAVGETGEKPKSFKEKAYNALGGKYKSQAAEAHREMVQKRNDADDKARRANAQGRAANAHKKAGNVRDYMANKEGARQLDKEAKGARLSQWEATKKANRAQWKYDHSIAGLYDKATGKYKQAHKKTAIPKMVDRFKYEWKDGPNSKLFKNGKGKAKTAKEQAKAEVWNAADYQIKAKEHNDMANTLGGNTNYVGQVFKEAAAKETRLAEGSYRRAAALAKQSSSDTSTSSRPRARKKKHTSGGSGVTVRRPGRKPVSRTKRVTQSSTGVKRRGSTGSGRSVRRGA